MGESSKVRELFGRPARNDGTDWRTVVAQQQCPFLARKCLKNRKSEPEIAIGTCTVGYGGKDVLICPHRLLQGGRIFNDCLHLLTLHTVGNDLHLVPEVSLPGGSVDYFLVSARKGKVVDFVGIELQTMDTTGTVWPERQRFLSDVGIPVSGDVEKSFGMNWKMTAKTTLVQLHHKIGTFEHLSKHLVLVLQDCLFNYMAGEFTFAHMNDAAPVGDPMHFHVYGVEKDANGFSIGMVKRASTDSAGIAVAMGLQAEANVELEYIHRLLEAKMSNATLFSVAGQVGGAR